MFYEAVMVGLHLRVSGQSINAFSSPHNIVGGKDRRQLQGYWKDPGESQLGYTVPNLKVEYAMRNTHVPVGPWRGVNTNQNAIYLECFMDEVARAAGKDPLAFRRNLIKNHPKHLGVLDAVWKQQSHILSPLYQSFCLNQTLLPPSESCDQY